MGATLSTFTEAIVEGGGDLGVLRGGGDGGGPCLLSQWRRRGSRRGPFFWHDYCGHDVLERPVEALQLFQDGGGEGVRPVAVATAAV